MVRVENWGKKIPKVAVPLQKYAPKEFSPFKHPDLVHDDLERQNILCEGNKITGVVDLNSLRVGDILYEYGHFLFNNVLCDPDVSQSVFPIYIDLLIKAGKIKPADIAFLYSHIYQYAISDVIEFNNLSLNPISPQHRLIDMVLLVRQYEKALMEASIFFNNGRYDQRTV